MIREELLKVYAYAGAIWSSFKLPNNDLELALMNEVWLNKLSEYDLSIIFTALDEYARTNAFCNIIQVAELCKRFEAMRAGTYVDEDMILREIKEAVSYDKCRENYAKLSPIAKKFVSGSHILARWAMDEAFNSVIVSNLRKEIKAYFENERMQESLNKIQKLSFNNQNQIEDRRQKSDNN